MHSIHIVIGILDKIHAPDMSCGLELRWGKLTPKSTKFTSDLHDRVSASNFVP